MLWRRVAGFGAPPAAPTPPGSASTRPGTGAWVTATSTSQRKPPAGRGERGREAVRESLEGGTCRERQSHGPARTVGDERGEGGGGAARRRVGVAPRRGEGAHARAAEPRDELPQSGNGEAGGDDGGVRSLMGSARQNGCGCVPRKVPPRALTAAASSESSREEASSGTAGAGQPYPPAADGGRRGGLPGRAGGAVCGRPGGCCCCADATLPLAPAAVVGREAAESEESGRVAGLTTNAGSSASLTSRRKLPTAGKW